MNLIREDERRRGAKVSGGGWRSITGVGIVCFFAAYWAWTAAGVLPAGTAGVRIVVVLVSFALLILRTITDSRVSTQPVNRKLLIFTIVGEVVALWIMGAVLGTLRRPDLLLPGLAIIVGLHFYPMARAVRVQAYNATAVAMTLAGFASLTLSGAARTGFLGFACCVILWITIGRSLIEAGVRNVRDC